jgi:hypothetical protein
MAPNIHRPMLQNRQPSTLAPIVNLVPSCHLAGAIAPTAMPDGTYHKVQPQRESATSTHKGAASRATQGCYLSGRRTCRPMPGSRAEVRTLTLSHTQRRAHPQSSAITPDDSLTATLVVNLRGPPPYPAHLHRSEAIVRS